MRFPRGWARGDRLALATLALSGALGTAAALDAWRLDPLPAVSATLVPDSMPALHPHPADRSERHLLAAVARDPFRPDRRRPPGRYRRPGEAPPPAAYASAPPARVAMLRLLGVVVLPGGGLAALAGATGQSRVLRVGQSFEDFRLVRVEPGKAVLEGKDTTLVLRTPGAGGGP